MVMLINDPIHGHIELDSLCKRIIDTPQFQRLRHLKQLGSAYRVFPGASHNRFEHSIGTCYLAGVMIDHLRKLQPELGISDSEAQCVKVAGLCHDLGHGPFSHIFDNEFMQQVRPDLAWTHELASAQLVEVLVRENEIPVSDADVAFIQDLISGQPRAGSKDERSSKGYLFEIVANKRNSVDVDKFDYIQRDCYNVGIKSSLDSKRLIHFSRVIDNQICFNQKEVFNLYELFHTRYSLFKRVYTHKVGKAIEFMIVDALIAAEPYLKISDRVQNMSEYLHLNDSIILEIERSKEPELAKSRRILHRLATRDLYKHADQVQIPLELQDLILASINNQAVLESQNTGGSSSPLSSEDFIIETLILNYAMKDRNPVDSIRFFGKYNHSKCLKPDQVSCLLPEKYQEVIVRVFCRKAEKLLAVQGAFRNLIARLNEEIGAEYNLESNSVTDLIECDDEDGPFAANENMFAPSSASLTPLFAPMTKKCPQSPFASPSSSSRRVPVSSGISPARVSPLIKDCNSPVQVPPSVDGIAPRTPSRQRDRRFLAESSPSTPSSRPTSALLASPASAVKIQTFQGLTLPEDYMDKLHAASPVGGKRRRLEE